MENILQQIHDLLQLLGDIILSLVPVGVAFYYGFRKKYNKKIKELKKQDHEKAQQELLHFSHVKSIWSMKNLEEICNIYVDRSHADCVLYLQLENGTMADSKLQNMFITCMAESNRYTNLPKRMNKIQRLPLQSIVSYIEGVNQSDKVEYITSELNSDTGVKARDLLFPQNISAWRMRVVRNRSGYIVGYIVFEYLFDAGKNGVSEFRDDEQPSSLIDQCQAAIESELLRYNNQIESKRKELGL